MTNLISKSVLATKYDPQQLWDAAILQKSGVTEVERDTWLQHPLTRSLLYGIEGDIANMFLEWSNGAYAHSLVEDGMQRGKLAALDQMGETIRHMEIADDD